MTYEAALKTLQVSQVASLDTARAAWRRLSRTHHPDRGGDGATMAAINAAWDVVRNRFATPNQATRPTPTAHSAFSFSSEDMTGARISLYTVLLKETTAWVEQAERANPRVQRLLKRYTRVHGSPIYLHQLTAIEKINGALFLSFPTRLITSGRNLVLLPYIQTYDGSTLTFSKKRGCHSILDLDDTQNPVMRVNMPSLGWCDLRMGNHAPVCWTPETADTFTTATEMADLVRRGKRAQGLS